MKIKRKTFLLFAVSLTASLVVSPVTSTHAKERVTFNNVTLPQPKKGQAERLADIRISAKRISPRTFSSTEFTFYLNRKGRVDSIGWSYQAKDSLVFRPYEDSLMATTFESGKIGGKKADFGLVAKLFVMGNEYGARGIVDLPVSTHGELLDYALALKSLEMQSYHPPKLNEFPSYFYRKPGADSDRGSMYEFAIVRVKLDSVGVSLGREVVFASDSGLGEMIQVASGWADFSPAEIDGQPVASEGYVFVRFFREIPYPVAEWRGVSDGASAGLEELRVSWLPGNQFGDVAPVQRGSQLLQLTMVMAFSSGTEKYGQLRIDGRGRARVSKLSGLTGKVDKELAYDKLKLIPFYPAFRIVEDSSTARWGISYLNAIGSLKLVPLDSVTYEVQTEFIDRYNTTYRGAKLGHSEK